MKSTTRLLALLGVAAGALVFATDADAQVFGRCDYNSSYGNSYGNYSNNFGGSYGTSGYGGVDYGRYNSAPIYHGPSVHYDRVYHPTTTHWTPRRGVHTHGHYDVVPHYTPGHFDRLHGNHIDLNPRYHHGH